MSGRHRMPRRGCPAARPARWLLRRFIAEQQHVRACPYHPHPTPAVALGRHTREDYR